MAPHSLVSVGVESPGRDWEARPWHLHGVQTVIVMAWSLEMEDNGGPLDHRCTAPIESGRWLMGGGVDQNTCGLDRILAYQFTGLI